MTDDELDERLQRWISESATRDVPASLRQPAHVIATRRLGPGRSRRASFATLGVAATFVVIAALALRPARWSEPNAALVPTVGASTAAVTPLASALERSSPWPTPARSDWTSITWTEAGKEPFAGPGNQYLQDVAAIGERFVVVGYETGPTPTAIVWMGSATEPWTRVAETAPIFEDAIIDRVARTNDGLIAIGRPGEDNARGTVLWTSLDGRTWKRLGVDPATFENATDVQVVATPAGLLAWAVRPDSSFTTDVWRSVDGGATWSADDNATTTFTGSVVSLVAGPNGLLATGSRITVPRAGGVFGPDGVGVAWTSPDGIHWLPASVTDAHGLGPALVARDGMLAAGSSHAPSGAIGRPEYWHSTDGRSWAPSTNPRLTNLAASVASDGDRIYVMDPGGTWASTDGESWSALAVSVQGFNGEDIWRRYRLGAGPGGLVATGETDQGASGDPNDQTDGLVWQALPGPPPPGAVPMPTPMPEHDTPCASPFINPDGTCG